MIDIIIEFLLVCVVGIAMIAATFIVADASGDWMERTLYRLYRRWQATWIRVGWQEVAARHKRKVRI